MLGKCEGKRYSYMDKVGECHVASTPQLHLIPSSIPLCARYETAVLNFYNSIRLD